MKYIQKSTEPPSLTAWKALANENWQPQFAELKGQEKQDLYAALLKEQGFICCYCTMQITRSICHIEHCQPQHQYPTEELEYGNLLASCQGESDTPPPTAVHCGHKKSEWYDANLFVSPLQPDCATYFKFLGSGEIAPTDEPNKRIAAQTTIDRLQLNIGKLQAMRRTAIAAALQDIEDLTPDELERLTDSYQQRDADGRFLPFCSAIAYILALYYLPNYLPKP